MLPREYHAVCHRRRRHQNRPRLCRPARVAPHAPGMTFSRAAVWVFLLATVCRASAEQHQGAPLADANGLYVPGLDEQVDLAEVFEQGEQELYESENEAARLQKLASLLSVLRSTLNERQHGQAAAEEDSQQLPGGYPAALLPLIKDDDKRGSYMSLCHFKICNMGRKRNLRWSPFMRM